MTPSFLEEVWQHREEEVYPRLFGHLGHGIYPLPPEAFAALGIHPDPRWLHIGVFECPATQERSHTVYVTSGLSNPWELTSPPDDPDAPSGLGVELAFATDSPGMWATQLISRVAAFQLALAAGHFPGRPLLADGDRIPIRGPIQPASSSQLSWLFVAQDQSPTGTHKLASGCFSLLDIVGVTENEAAFGRERGAEALLALLISGGAYPVTEVHRTSLI